MWNNWRRMMISLLLTFCTLTQLGFFAGRLAEGMGISCSLPLSTSIGFQTVVWHSSKCWALIRRRRNMNTRSIWHILSLLEYLEWSKSVKLHCIFLCTEIDHLGMRYLTRPNSWRMKGLGCASMRPEKGQCCHFRHLIHTSSVLAVSVLISSTCTIFYCP